MMSHARIIFPKKSSLDVACHYPYHIISGRTVSLYKKYWKLFYRFFLKPHQRFLWNNEILFTLGSRMKYHKNSRIILWVSAHVLRVNCKSSSYTVSSHRIPLLNLLPQNTVLGETLGPNYQRLPNTIETD